MEEAVKTDETGWFKRTWWLPLPLPKGRNLAHLGYITRLPDRNEVKLQQLFSGCLNKEALDGVRDAIAKLVQCFR
jgi:hypothetical protein